MTSALKAYRESTDTSLEAIGNQLGVDKSTVLRWEQGTVPAERVLHLERATGISRHDLRPDLYPREGEAA
jgi:DNA-binding transcriptional regulator YdaS (Cro superfamily)